MGSLVISNTKFDKISLSDSLIRTKAKNNDNFYNKIELKKNNFTNILTQYNTNILHVQREYVSVGSTSESYAICSSNMKISKNNFNSIIGCPMVDTGLIFVSCTDTFEINYSKFYEPEKTVYNYYFDKVVPRTYLLSDLTNLKKIVAEEVQNTIYLEQNYFEEVFVGLKIPTKFDYQGYSDGTLIQLQNIPSVSFINLNFKNVGQFSVEQLKKSYLYIFGYEISVRPVSSSGSITQYTTINNWKSDLEPYFANFLACCLIMISGGIQFQLEGSTFDNVWLIDKLSAYQQSDSIHQGLILHLQNYNGDITIGSKSSKQDTSVSWAGSGNQLFSMHHSSNIITSLTFNKAYFQQIYGSVSKNSKNIYTATILSGYISGGSTLAFGDEIKKITLQDIKFENCFTDSYLPMITLWSGQMTLSNVQFINNYDWYTPYINSILKKKGLRLFKEDEQQLKNFVAAPLSLMVPGSSSNDNKQTIESFIDIKNCLFNNIQFSQIDYTALIQLQQTSANNDNNMQPHLNILNSNFTSITKPKASILYFCSYSSVSNNINIYFYNCLIQENTFTNGIIELEVSVQSLVIDNCKIVDNFGSQTSFLYLSSNKIAQVYITNSLFTSNEGITFNYMKENFGDGTGADVITQRERQSLIFANKQTGIIVDNCKVTKVHQVVTGAFMQLFAGSSATISNTLFQENQVQKQASVLIMIETQPSSIDNCDFILNQNIQPAIGTGLINMLSASMLTITNSRFYDNYCNETTPGIYVVLSSGNFIQVVSGSLVYINSTYFRNGIGQEGGAIYLIGQSTIYINNCTFINNTASTGGAIYSVSFKGLEIVNSTYFLDNSADTGQSLYSMNSQERVFINDTIFSSNKLASQNSYFINNRGQKEDEAEGGAINFFCAQNTDSFQFFPNGNSARYCSLFLDQVTFLNNTSNYNGGAIKWNYIEPEMSNLTFINNKARVYGDNISSYAKYLTQLNIDQFKQLKRVFDKNDTESRRYLTTLVASNDQLLNQTNTNKNEISNIKGQQSGGTAEKLYFTLIDKYGQIMYSDESSKLFVGVKSDLTFEQLKQTGYFQPTIESNTQFSIEHGIFTVQDLILTGLPSHSYYLDFSTDGIKIDYPDTIELYSTKPQLQKFNVTVSLRSCIEGEEFQVSGKCKQCEAPDYYSLQLVDKITPCKECQKTKSYCEGGNLIYPKAGYWRNSNESDNFFKCRNDEACLGKNFPENNLLGKCAQGYSGKICIDCEIGYSRTGSTYKCSKCPDPASNSFKLIGLMFIMIALLYLMIRSTLQSALQKKNYVSVYIRILTNHLQLLMLTASFDLKWPDQLQEFFNSVKPVSEASTQFISFDCFIDSRKEENDTQTTRIIMWKMVMMALAPIIVVIVSIITWRLIYYWYSRKYKAQNSQKPKQIEFDDETQNRSGIKKSDQRLNSEDQNQGESITKVQNDTLYQQSQHEDYKRLKELFQETQNKSISSIIIILFLIHPTITNELFNQFNCQDIDGTKRLYDDLEITCYVGQHYYFSLGIALPGIIIWSLGIPTFGWIKLSQHKDELHLVQVKQTLGFLYNGYREHSYFWEMVIMYRKIIIIFIAVFLQQSGKIVQFMQEIKYTLRSKNPTIYKYLYLFGNQRKLEKELNFQRYLDKHQDFIQDLVRLSDYFQKRKNEYLSGYIPIEDKEFRASIIGMQKLKAEVEKRYAHQNRKSVRFDQQVQEKEYHNDFILRPRHKHDDFEEKDISLSDYKNSSLISKSSQKLIPKKNKKWVLDQTSELNSNYSSLTSKKRNKQNLNGKQSIKSFQSLEMSSSIQSLSDFQNEFPLNYTQKKEHEYFDSRNIMHKNKKPFNLKGKKSHFESEDVTNRFAKSQLVKYEDQKNQQLVSKQASQVNVQTPQQKRKKLGKIETEKSILTIEELVKNENNVQTPENNFVISQDEKDLYSPQFITEMQSQTDNGNQSSNNLIGEMIEDKKLNEILDGDVESINFVKVKKPAHPKKGRKQSIKSNQSKAQVIDKLLANQKFENFSFRQHQQQENIINYDQRHISQRYQELLKKKTNHNEMDHLQDSNFKYEAGEIVAKRKIKKQQQYLSKEIMSLDLELN
eukprot:403331092